MCSYVNQTSEINIYNNLFDKTEMLYVRGALHDKMLSFREKYKAEDAQAGGHGSPGSRSHAPFFPVSTNQPQG